MELYGQKSSSIPQKLIINLLEILFLWLSYWILFQQGGDWVAKHLHINNALEGFDRRKIIFTFNMIIFFRLGFMMFYLLKRKIPSVVRISIPIAFALYYVGYSLFVLSSTAPIDILDYFAIALFIFGSALNTVGEVLREI